MTWLSVKCELDEQVSYRSIGPYPYLGEDCPLTKAIDIKHRTVRYDSIGSTKRRLLRSTRIQISAMSWLSARTIRTLPSTM